MEDTIAAIATPPGEGGIGIVRVSGPDALAIAKRVFRTPSGRVLHEFSSHKMNYGQVVDPETGEPVDEVLLVFMREPKSYTAEDVVEVHCHGGAVVLARIMRVILRHGARLAEPGEFTRRAFVNGRIDLAQAEAVIDTIRSTTEASQRIAVRQLGGQLSQRIKQLADRLLDVLAHLEATLDFPDEDISHVERDNLQEEVEEMRGEIGVLLDTADAGRVYREGVSTVIVGRPNVGKSSLLNALVREQRAIVTEIPGTTRDVLEEIINVRGIPIRIIDTAGLRKTGDKVEMIGVERARQVLESADLILFVLDISQGIEAGDQEIMDLVQRRRGIVVLNKIDLEAALDSHGIEEFCPGWPRVKVSAISGVGLPELEETIWKTAVGKSIDPTEHVIVSNVRHKRLLEEAEAALADCLTGLEQGVLADLLSIDVRTAWEKLGEITGEKTTEDLLDRIFSRFCIGK